MTSWGWNCTGFWTCATIFFFQFIVLDMLHPMSHSICYVIVINGPLVLSSRRCRHLSISLLVHTILLFITPSFLSTFRCLPFSPPFLSCFSLLLLLCPSSSSSSLKKNALTDLAVEGVGHPDVGGGGGLVVPQLLTVLNQNNIN